MDTHRDLAVLDGGASIASPHDPIPLLEVRALEAGHMAMLKCGNLHGYESEMNPTDEDRFLVVSGG